VLLLSLLTRSCWPASSPLCKTIAFVAFVQTKSRRLRQERAILLQYRLQTEREGGAQHPSEEKTQRHINTSTIQLLELAVQLEELCTYLISSLCSELRSGHSLAGAEANAPAALYRLLKQLEGYKEDYIGPLFLVYMEDVHDTSAGLGAAVQA
ncbi:hypothetical protein BRADI_1g00364v3, partial [Brachypodium distachyon]